jgi:hypothetical protein
VNFGVIRHVSWMKADQSWLGGAVVVAPIGVKLPRAAA